MRATRTEIGRAGRDFGGIVRAPRFGQSGQRTTDRVGLASLLDENLAQFLCNHYRVQRHPRRKQLQPTAVLVIVALVPAIDPPSVAVVKNRFLDLHLDQLALFLDHDDQIQIARPVVESVHIQREGLADLVGGDAETLGLVLVDAQQAQRMDQVQPVLARRDQPDLGTRLAPHPLVHTVGTRKRLRGKAFVVDHPRFLGDPVIVQPDAQAPLRAMRYRG